MTFGKAGAMISRKLSQGESKMKSIVATIMALSFVAFAPTTQAAVYSKCRTPQGSIIIVEGPVCPPGTSREGDA